MSSASPAKQGLAEMHVRLDETGEDDAPATIDLFLTFAAMHAAWRDFGDATFTESEVRFDDAVLRVHREQGAAAEDHGVRTASS